MEKEGEREREREKQGQKRQIEKMTWNLQTVLRQRGGGRKRGSSLWRGPKGIEVAEADGGK